ncbi:MAG: hypothetical protein IKX83_05585 [Clostridia bacterium]|nr:hypothetical protein [Clostridia bacterium]
MEGFLRTKSLKVGLWHVIWTKKGKKLRTKHLKSGSLARKTKSLRGKKQSQNEVLGNVVAFLEEKCGCQEGKGNRKTRFWGMWLPFWKKNRTERRKKATSFSVFRKCDCFSVLFKEKGRDYNRNGPN